MTPGRNMEIPLHLVPLQTAINPTRPSRLASLQLWRLPKLPFHTPHLSQHMPHMRVLFLLLDHLPTVKLMHAPIHINPMAPIRRVPVQEVASKDAIPAGVLDVDVQIGAEHGDDDVEVYLQVVGDAFFDAEEVGFVAGVPATEFGEGEHGGDYDEEEGRVAACGGATGVGWFCLGWGGNICQFETLP